ncbi:MAG TPA: c-type cytochrome domain-containing protein, partial [Planctomycetaceae bacterium]|nr:c-type cytochrome domain-containing protein [Planctomycetaceae bacterium]
MSAGDVPQSVGAFLSNHCAACHEGTEAEAGLDLTALSANPNLSGDFKRWVRIFDRVREGEMPPQDADEVSPDDRQAFLDATGDWLRTNQLAEWQELGRVRGRRLTNLQLER